MIRETVHYTGRVQGVGFRHTTATLARGHAVAGYVRNLPDGRVKLVAEGPAEAVVALVDAVQSAMAGNIQTVESARSLGTGEFGSPGDDAAFRIRL
jgi:acylphosphatase